MPTMAPPRPHAPPNPNQAGPGNPNAGPQNPNAQPNQAGGPNQAPPNPNQQPNPNQDKLETISFVLTNLDNNVDAYAREAAHEELATEAKKGPIWKKVVTGMWRTVMREHRLVKKTAEKREEILQSGNLRHHQGESDMQWREDKMRQYTSEYAEELTNTDAGETFNKFDKSEAEKDPGLKKIREESLDAVCDYARGDIASLDDLKQVVRRLREDWQNDEEAKKHLGSSKFTVDNIIAMGIQTKAALDARQGLDAVDKERLLREAREEAVLITGEAKVGSDVEIEATRSERLAKKLRNIPFINEGRLAKIGAVLGNEVVLSAMVSLGVGLMQRGASLALAPGVAAGVIAGLRERRALRDERMLMDRRLDRGEAPDLDNKRQAEIDATRYESRPAGELIAEIGDLYDQNGDLKLRNRTDLDSAIKLQAEILARIKLTNQGNRLISYADNSQRFDLGLAVSKLKADLGKLFTNPVSVTMLGIQQDETYDDLVTTQRDINIGLRKIEITEQDRLFNKLANREGLKRGAITFGSVVLFGSVVREAAEHVAAQVAERFANWRAPRMEFASSESPFGNEIPDPTPDHIGGTAPEMPHIGAEAPDISEHIGGEATEVPHIGGKAPEIPNGPIGGGSSSEAPSPLGTKTPETPHIGGKAPENPHGHIGGQEFAEGKTMKLGENTKMVLPEGFHVEQNGSQLKLTTPNGTVIEGLLDKNGKLDQSTLELMKSYNLNVIPHEDIVKGEPKVTHETVNGREFRENHKDEMVKIHRKEWMTNQHEKVSDLNEFGADNEKLENGKIRISIRGMTADGSFNGKSGVNWHEAAKDGHLMAYLSASRGTQSHALEIPIGEKGYVDIDEDSPAGALFNKNGRFIGGYQEIAVKGGVNADGETNIAVLATVVGTKHPEINDVIVTPTTEKAYTYTVLPPSETAANVAEADDGRLIPFIPVAYRRNLGAAIVTPAAAATGTAGPGNPSGPNSGPANPNTGNAQPNANQQTGGGGTGGQTNPNSAPNGGQSGPNAQPGNQNTAGNQPGGTATNPNNQNSAPNNGPTNPNQGSTQQNKANKSGGKKNTNPNTSGGANPNTSSKKKQPGSQANAGSNKTGGQAGPNAGAQTGPNTAGAQTGGPTGPNTGTQTGPNTSSTGPNWQQANTGGGRGQSTANGGTNNQWRNGARQWFNEQNAGGPQQSAGGARQSGQPRPTNTGQTPPGGATNNNGTNTNTNTNTGPKYQYPTSFTPAERSMIDNIGADDRIMPTTFTSLPWNPNMNALSRKIIALTLHQLIDKSNRQPGESEDMWRARVVAAGRAYSQQALGALGQTLPGLRPFVQEAFESFLQVTYTPPAGNSSSNASSSASAGPTT